MNENIKIGDIVEGTHGKMKRVEDFLPRPEELVLKKPEVEKITMYLDRETLVFFREEATKLGASYQEMMRTLLKKYVQTLKADGHNLNT